LARKTIELIFFVCVSLFLAAVFDVIFNVPVARASGTIHIRADGSIDPPTAPILSLDNVTYTFTGNINDTIEIERSNIVVDGNGFTLQGVEAEYGFYSVSKNNVTIKNTNIEGFYGSGIHFNTGSYLTVCGNNITSNGEFGIETWGISTFNIFGNNITANGVSPGWGGANIFLGRFPYGASSGGSVTENYISGSLNGIMLLGPSNMIYRNNIVANDVGLYIGDSYNTIFGNNILNNGGDGISVQYASAISDLIVNNNTIMFNGGDSLFLLSYNYIYNATVASNIVSSNGENGILAIAANRYSGAAFDLEISANIISANHENGIWIGRDVKANLTRNSIAYNTYGVSYSTTIDNSAQYNDIYRNSHGMNVTDGATVNATYNYWGDTTGPYHNVLNANGTGNPINGNGEDLKFIPFLSNPVGQINERPVAALTIDQTVTRTNQTVVFDASQSTDDDQVEYCFFDFGDGTSSGWITSPLTTHQYGSSGIYNVTLIVADNFGVTSIGDGLTHAMIRVMAPPTANFTYSPEAPLSNTPLTLDASTSYDSDGTIESYRWDFGDGNVTILTNPVTSHVYNVSGTYTINLTVTDNDGLTHSSTESITVTEDSAPPTTLREYDGLWHAADFTINLTASDDLSGVAETYYRINDGPPKSVGANGQPFIATEDANNTLEYWSPDNVGNEELPHNILTGIKLDKTAPTGSILINGGADYSTSPRAGYTLSATDSTSDVADMRLSFDNVTYTDWEAYATYKLWILPWQGVEGLKTVYAQFRDNAGLVSTYSDTIILDMTGPVIEIPSREPAGSVQPGQSVKVTVNIIDATSQVQNVTLYYSLDNGTTWEEPVPMNIGLSTGFFEGTIQPQQAGTLVEYKIVAYDYAGNIRTLDGAQEYLTYQIASEFPSFLVLSLFMIATLLAITIYRRKRIASAL
jgi:PKD repeat protein